MIHSFRPNKDNFIFIHLQKGGYTPYYIKNLRFFYI